MEIRGRYIRYELLDFSSRVYKGYDNQKKIDVAIKVYQTMSQGDLEQMERFSKQSDELNFNQVINLYEVIKERNEIILIMEYANYGNLYNYMQKNPTMSQDLKKRIMLQIASSLQELHQFNYLHRAMNPENILVQCDQSNNPSFKISDFGLAKQENNAQTKQIGVPFYMAPELLQDVNNRQSYNQEVDIWALGCIYYQLITQQSLFQGNSQKGLIQNITNAKQEWIDNQIDQLIKYSVIERERKLLKLMISKDPQMRPNTFDIIKTLNGSENFINQKIQIEEIEKIKKKEYEDQLKYQEENLKNLYQRELVKQQQGLEEQFKQQYFKNEEEKLKQQQILKQQIVELQIKSDKQLKCELELQNIQMQKQMDKQINESRLLNENQQKQLESQISQLQQTQIQQINSCIQEFNEFAPQIQQIQEQLNKFHIKSKQINEEYEKLEKYFQDNNINVKSMSQEQDSAQISKYIETIKGYNKQLNQQIQNIQLNIEKEQFSQSSGIEKQKRFDLLKGQFQSSKIDLDDELQLQIQYLNTFIHGKVYLEQIYQLKFQNIRLKYEQEIQKLDQLVELQDFQKFQDQIQIMKQITKQLKMDCQNLLEQIKEYEENYLYDDSIKKLKDQNSSLKQNIIDQFNYSKANQDFQARLQTCNQLYIKKISEIENRSQSIKTTIYEVQEIGKQMQSDYSQLQKDFQIASNQEAESLQNLQQSQIEDQKQKIDEQQQLQSKVLQSKYEEVATFIEQLQQLTFSNNQLKNQLNQINSNFQTNFTEFKELCKNSILSDQLTTMTSQVIQFYSQCVELKTKIEMEAQHIQKQLEQAKKEFQQEVQAQVQKIEDLQNKATSIDPSLQKDIATITQTIKNQQQQINEYQGQDTDEQRITNIRNAKQQLMTESTSIIQRLSVSNQANLYFNQVLSNYRSKLDKVIDTVTLRLSQIKQNLTELQQIKSKTIEINSLIQNLTQYQQQYEGQLHKYQQSKQKQFDQTQLEYIQAEYEQAIRAQGQIETESTSSYNLYSQVYQYFGQHLMNVFNASKTQLENEFIKTKKEKMNGIIANFLKENKTIKTDQECKKILDENIEQINNDFQQLREQVDVMLKQNPQEQKSFSDFDKGLREIDKQVGNIQEYTQKLIESEKKSIEQFEETIKYTSNNLKNYTTNQVKLRAKIKDQILIRRILQMKDQQITNEQIKGEAMKVYNEIQVRILKNL